MWGFGAAKRKTKKRTAKKTSNNSIKYANRTKGGVRRVVQVYSKGSKNYYKSDNKPVPKSNKVFARKAQASSFGSAKRLAVGKSKVSRRPFGYTVCQDKDFNKTFDNEVKYKVYKFHPVRWEGMTYRVIMDKSKTTGQMKIFIVPNEAKVFNVKVSGTEAQMKASTATAKKKAQKLALNYAALRYAGADLSLVECKDAPGLANGATGAAAPALKSFIGKMQATLGDPNDSPLGTQVRMFEQFNGFNNSMRATNPFKTSIFSENFPISRGLRQFNNTRTGMSYRGPYKVVNEKGDILSKNVYNNIITKSARLGNNLGEDSTGIEFDPEKPYETVLGLKRPTAFGRRRRRTPVAFGQRINYGFSKYF